MQIGSAVSSFHASPSSAGPQVNAKTSTSLIAQDSSATSDTASNAVALIVKLPAFNLRRVVSLDEAAPDSVSAFGAQLKKAAAAAGLDMTQPINISEGANGDAVVDPSTKDAANVQLLIDNSRTLSSAYHAATELERELATQKAGLKYCEVNRNAYQQATTQAQQDSLNRGYMAATAEASAKQISILV